MHGVKSPHQAREWGRASGELTRSRSKTSPRLPS